MSTLHSHKELIVWQKGMTLVKEIYRITKLLPKTETYALTSQMLRAAISIPSNIAEGFTRNSRNEYKQFLAIANGSAAELETQLLIAQEEYKALDFSEALQLVLEEQKMLHTMILKLNT